MAWGGTDWPAQGSNFPLVLDLRKMQVRTRILKDTSHRLSHDLYNSYASFLEHPVSRLLARSNMARKTTAQTRSSKGVPTSRSDTPSVQGMAA